MMYRYLWKLHEKYARSGNRLLCPSTQGFVQVGDFFKLEEMGPVREATAELVDKLAQKLYNAGHIKRQYKSLSLIFLFIIQISYAT